MNKWYNSGSQTFFQDDTLNISQLLSLNHLRKLKCSYEIENHRRKPV